MTTSIPLQSLLTLFDHVGDLKSLPRTGWLFAGVTAPESLADHTCAVALYTLFLAEQINRDPSAAGLSQPLSVERALKLALIHDLAESIVTDLPRRTSELMGQAAKESLEARALHRLVDGLPHGDDYQRLWEEYTRAATPEARLVKDVDKLEMVLQAQRYAQRGHRNLQEFCEGHRWHYSLCATIYQQILS